MAAGDVTVEAAFGDNPFGTSAFLQCGGGFEYIQHFESSTGYDVTDVDLRMRVSADDWQEDAIVAIGVRDPDDNTWRYVLYIDLASDLTFAWYDGTTQNTVSSTASASLTDGSAVWLRATLDANNGAGGYDVDFYTGTTDTNDHTLVSWSALGSTVTGGSTTSVTTGTGVYGWFGSLRAEILGTNVWYRFSGDLYAAAILDAIGGTEIAEPTLQQAVGTRDSFTDGQTNTWTIENDPYFVYTDAPSRTWTDITANVGEVNISRGRSNMLEDFQAGTFQITLKDPDRDFDPINTASPYYSGSTQILPALPVRVTAENSSGLLSAYTTAVNADSPTAFLQLQDDDATDPVVDSADSHDGTVTGSPTYEATGPGTGVRALEYGANHGGRIAITDHADFSSSDMTVEIWAKNIDKTVWSNAAYIASKDNGTGGTREWWLRATAADTVEATIGRSGQAILTWLSASGTVSDLDVWHHYVFTLNGTTEELRLYVDGVEVGNDTTSSGTRQGDSAAAVNLASRQADDDHEWEGAISLFAYYTTELSAARVLAHYNALASSPLIYGFVLDQNGWEFNYQTDPAYSTVTMRGTDLAGLIAKFSLEEKNSSRYRGDLTGKRIERVLANIGIPTAWQDIDTGTVRHQATTWGEPALTHVQQINAAEAGALYVAKDGTLTYDDRHAPLSVTRQTSSQETFSDDGSDTPYKHGSVDLKYGEQVRNRVRVSAEDGTVADKHDLTSIAAYTEIVFDRLNLTHESVTDSIAAAEWYLTNYKDPRAVLRGITILPTADTTALDSACARELRDRVTVEYTPPNTGDNTQISQEVTIEKIEHRIVPGWWETRYVFESIPSGLAASTTFATFGGSNFGSATNCVLAY